MSPDGSRPSAASRPSPERLSLPPAPGQTPLALAALIIGLLLMAIQLWLLTVALELYLGGSGGLVWPLAAVSGAIFLGGLGVMWVLARHPRVRQAEPEAAGFLTR